MIILYKDPRGERIFNRSMSQGQPTLTGMSLSDAERDKLHDLEKHCRDLETRLGKYEVRCPTTSAIEIHTAFLYSFVHSMFNHFEV